MKNRMTTVLSLLVPFSIATCVLAASPQSNDDDGYTKALGILTRNCAGCHQQADHPGALFLNKATLSEPQTLDLVIKLIETSQMPPAHIKFRESADGKILLQWLKAERARQKKKNKS